MCAYCGERAVHMDHVVHRFERKKRAGIPTEFLGLEPACMKCNITKGTRRLVPPSWAHQLDAMNEFFGGTRWRTWDGGWDTLRETAR